MSGQTDNGGYNMADMLDIALTHPTPSLTLHVPYAIKKQTPTKKKTEIEKSNAFFMLLFLCFSFFNTQSRALFS